VAENIEPVAPDDHPPQQDSRLDAADAHSLPGRSFGLREAIILSVVSCAAAVTVAWLHI